jgi:hypothetical protein
VAATGCRSAVLVELVGIEPTTSCMPCNSRFRFARFGSQVTLLELGSDGLETAAGAGRLASALCPVNAVRAMRLALRRLIRSATLSVLAVPPRAANNGIPREWLREIVRPALATDRA